MAVPAASYIAYSTFSKFHFHTLLGGALGKTNFKA
jgi:hypothetical protein